MDIWAWTYSKKRELHKNGHGRLAEIMDDLPHYSCNDYHDRVDALFPEALALARQIEDPWCEIFVRHWHLQSQVLSRNNAKGMLEEAIDLLDFSHREEHQECPQRICTVQDLASCYGIQDGPGFAEERIHVATETLSSINGTWPCYDCVGAELIDALIDNRDIQGAEEQLQALEIELNKHDKSASTDLLLSKAKIMTLKGDYEPAIKILNKADEPTGGERFTKGKRLLLAIAYCHLERWQEAHNSVLSFDEVIVSASDYDDWTHVQYLLAKNQQVEVNDNFIHQFLQLAHLNGEKGAIRYSINTLERLTELCIQFNYYFSAKTAVDYIEQLIPQLNKDLGASDKKNALLTQIEALPSKNQQWNFTSVEALLEHEFDSIDQRALALQQAQQNFPGDSVAVTELAKIYQLFYSFDKAEETLHGAWLQHQGNGRLEYFYGRFYLQQHGLQKYQQNFTIKSEDITEEQRWSRLWVMLEATESTSPQEALKFAEQLHTIDSEASGVLKQLMLLYRRTSDYDKAQQSLNRLIELEPDDFDLYWDKAILASLQKDWQALHQCIEPLKLKVDTSQDIQAQDYGSVRIRFEKEDGTFLNLAADWIGPVTARIRGIANEEEPIHYGDIVVFEPTALNRLDQKDENGDACDSEGYYTLLFPAIETIEKQEYCLYPVDGAHPGDEALDELIDKLVDRSIVVSVRSSDDYEIWYDSGENGWRSIPGLYMYLLLKEDHDLKSVSNTLQEFTEKQEHPLIWPRLLEAMGDIDGLEKQREISMDYDL